MNCTEVVEGGRGCDSMAAWECFRTNYQSSERGRDQPSSDGRATAGVVKRDFYGNGGVLPPKGWHAPHTSWNRGFPGVGVQSKEGGSGKGKGGMITKTGFIAAVALTMQVLVGASASTPARISLPSSPSFATRQNSYSAKRMISSYTCDVCDWMCQKGFYLDMVSSVGYNWTCTECGAGYTTRAAGATNSSQCLCDLGTYSSSLGSAECTTCPAGKYAMNMGSTQCMSCSVTSCSSGEYLENNCSTTQDGKCTACMANCSAGYYQSSDCNATQD
eukprot:747853-Hanusia_phi.AAC.1